MTNRERICEAGSLGKRMPNIPYASKEMSPAVREPHTDVLWLTMHWTLR